MLALRDHGFDALSSLLLGLLFLFGKLFFAHCILPQLLTDLLDALLLGHIHVVLCIVDLLSTHLLVLVSTL